MANYVLNVKECDARNDVMKNFGPAQNAFFTLRFKTFNLLLNIYTVL